MELLSLSPELLLIIVSYLDVPSLSSFRQTSLFASTLVSTSSELILRTIAINHGFADEKSCADSGVRFKEADLKISLEEAKKNQRSMDDEWDDVGSWEAFVKKRWGIDKRWKEGKCKERWLVPDHDAGMWRLKLDPDHEDGGQIVVSNPEGGYRGIGLDGVIKWESRPPELLYPHVELSQGYLLMMLNATRYLIWRRSNITSPPSPLLTSDPTQYTFFSSSMIQSDSTPSPSYLPYSIINTPFRCSATKLRYPLFAAVSPSEKSILIYNFITSELIATIDFSTLSDPSLRYVELLEDRVLLVGRKSITMWDWDGRNWEFPMESVVGVPEWTAVHHDTRGMNLVAIGEMGKLLWCKRFREGMEDGEGLAEKLTVVCEFGAPIIQLSVENDRAVFVVDYNDENAYGLWMLNLEEWNTMDDFKVLNASGRVDAKLLCYPLPMTYEPGRVECTSSQIFIASSSAYFPTTREGKRIRELRARATHAIPAWRTLEGDLVDKDGPERKGERTEVGNLLPMHSRVLRRHLRVPVHAVNTVNSLIVFDFGDKEEEELREPEHWR